LSKNKNIRRLAITALLTVFALAFASAAPSQASGYYRIKTRLSYAGSPLCLQSNGANANVSVATCSTSTKQKWALYNLNGYGVYANVGYSPSLALDAPTLSGGTYLQTRTIVGNSHQGWQWDSLYSTNGVIYLESNHNLVLQPTAITPSARVRLQPFAGVTGIQSWNIYTW